MGAILPAVALVLREADVEKVIQMDPVIAAVEAAMRELGEGTAQNEPRRRAFTPGGLLNVMFASFPGGGCTGLKAYTVAAGSVRFLVVIFALDGSVSALIEADLMGAYRTGAATAVAAKALWRGGPATVALIGAGHQASTQALAISRVLEIKEMRVFSRNPDRRAVFAVEQAGRLGVKVIPASSAEAAVRGADVVVTMTTSSEPVIEAGWVGDRALVAAAGSNYPSRTELPADLVARARTVIVDQLAAAQMESGDLIQAHEAGKFDWDRATELASLLTGTWKAPEEPGITLFESQGLALWDLAAASVVLPAARENGLGEEVKLL
ncbi:MAG: ornithine cyclodeaminase family protein [Candidatus Dormibacteraeota bacterium]|nr:ornithine cyclodeaminase family protein [Candidatus Dormibacteraeota bacterium]